MPSLATTRTTAGVDSALPALPVCPPPLTSTMADGGSVTVNAPLSLNPLNGPAAVTVTVPRLPVGVTVVDAPLVVLNDATDASEIDHTIGTLFRALFCASNARTLNATAPGETTVEVLGETASRVAVAPGPT